MSCYLSIRSCWCPVPTPCWLPVSLRAKSCGQGPRGPAGSGLPPARACNVTGMFPPRGLRSLFLCLGLPSSGCRHDTFPLSFHIVAQMSPSQSGLHGPDSPSPRSPASYPSHTPPPFSLLCFLCIPCHSPMARHPARARSCGEDESAPSWYWIAPQPPFVVQEE